MKPSRTSLRSRRCASLTTMALLTAALAALAATAAPAGPPPTLAERLHAAAVDSLRAGRLPEAYGRFVALADAGHAPAAPLATWMCLQGAERFGKDWDCSGEQLEAWAALTGEPAPVLVARHYGRSAIGAWPVRRAPR